MYTLSQTLTVVGLFFEFISVFVTIRKLFYGYYKRLEKGTFREEIRRDRIEGAFTLTFLIIGMVLQGITVFIG